MVPQSLDTLIDETAHDTVILHNDSKKLFIKIIPLLGIISVILFELFRHITLPMAVIFPIGIVLTWGPIILMFLHRVNQGYIEFDSAERFLTVYTKSGAKEFRKIPYDQITMRYEVQKGSKNPDCLDFCISSEKEPLYRLYLDSKQQWMYDEVLSFVREFTRGEIKEEIADIKVSTGSLDLAFGILITLGFFLAFAAILFGTPFFVAWFFNTGIAGGVMTLLFLFMILIAMNCKLGIQSKQWPSVKGRIISSAVNEHCSTSSSNSGNSTSTSWKPHIDINTIWDRGCCCSLFCIPQLGGDEMGKVC